MIPAKGIPAKDIPKGKPVEQEAPKKARKKPAPKE